MATNNKKSKRSDDSHSSANLKEKKIHVSYVCWVCDYTFCALAGKPIVGHPLDTVHM